MISIHESGLLQIWKRRWWPKANFCSGNTVTEAKPISVIDVQSAFYVCVIGIIIGTIAFVCEIIVYRFRHNKTVNGKCVLNSHISTISETVDSVDNADDDDEEGTKPTNEDILKTRNDTSRSKVTVRLNCRKHKSRRNAIV